MKKQLIFFLEYILYVLWRTRLSADDLVAQITMCQFGAEDTEREEEWRKKKKLKWCAVTKPSLGGLHVPVLNICQFD